MRMTLSLLSFVFVALAAAADEPQSVAIHSRHVLDVHSGTASEGWVVVRGERIAGIEHRAPAGARVIELGDATVLPGFIDCHVHLLFDWDDLSATGWLRMSAGTRTMMGLRPAEVVEAFVPLGVAAIGANCGKSLADTDEIVEELLAGADGVPLWVKPNAGVPRVVGEEVVYDAGPEDMARHLAGYAARGVQVVGGCCGTTPEHLAAIAAAVR